MTLLDLRVTRDVTFMRFLLNVTDVSSRLSSSIHMFFVDAVCPSPTDTRGLRSGGESQRCSSVVVYLRHLVLLITTSSSLKISCCFSSDTDWRFSLVFNISFSSPFAMDSSYRLRFTHLISFVGDFGSGKTNRHQQSWHTRLSWLWQLVLAKLFRRRGAATSTGASPPASDRRRLPHRW